MGRETQPLISPRVDDDKGKIENELLSRAQEAMLKGPDNETDND